MSLVTPILLLVMGVVCCTSRSSLKIDISSIQVSGCGSVDNLTAIFRKTKQAMMLIFAVQPRNI